MRRVIVAAIGVLALASCATTTSQTRTLDRHQAGFERVASTAEPLLALLPPERQVRARATLAALGTAIDCSRTATTAHQRAAAIAQVDAQLKALRSAMAR